jgi:hypothetical protein
LESYLNKNIEVISTITSLKDAVDKTEEQYIKNRTKLEAITGILKSNVKLTKSSTPVTYAD